MIFPRSRGRSDYAAGDHINAEPLYKRALLIWERALGPGHPTVANCLVDVAILCVEMGNTAVALRRMTRAAAIQNRNAAILLTAGSDEQKRVYMATLQEATYCAIALHVQLAPNAQDAKRLALTAILNRKGRVLDAMTESFTAMRRHLSAANQERLDQLRSISAQYSAQESTPTVFLGGHAGVGAMISNGRWGIGFEVRGLVRSGLGNQGDPLAHEMSSFRVGFEGRVPVVYLSFP